MSVFQNSFLAGRTSFGSGGGYSQPRARGGMMTKDQYGDAVRQALPQPMAQQSVAKQQFAPQPSGNYSAYAQQMAPSRPEAAPVHPQPMPTQPQVVRSQSAPGVIGSQSTGDGRTMSNAEYSKKLASFGSQDGKPLTGEQIFERAQWAQKNARAMA